MPKRSPNVALKRNQPFQWQLQTSRHDRSPCCHGPVVYVTKARRECARCRRGFGPPNGRERSRG